MTYTQFKRAKKRLGLSTAQLAKMLGVTGTQVIRMEAPPHKPWARKIQKPIVRLINIYLDGYRPKDWPQEVRS